MVYSSESFRGRPSLLLELPMVCVKCRTIKQRVSESAYDPNCLDCIKVSYSDYVLSGAKSQGARVRYADPAVEPPTREPAVRSGNEFVPRRI